jgi:membrane protein
VAWLRSVLQLSVVIAEGFVRDQLLLRAHALTYLTLLSIVPLLAIAVSLFDLLGGSERVTRLLVEQFAAGSPEAVDWILDVVSRVQFGALGGLGGAILILTTLLAVGNVELALNAIWGVTKQRPWVRRIPDYLAVVVVSPLLLGAALSLGASLNSQWLVQRLTEWPFFAALRSVGLHQAPIVLVIAGLTFVYWFLPNTEVRFRAALLGGIVAGLLFSIAQRLYLLLNVGVANYNAIFAGFAWFPLLLAWVYLEWAITLLGAEVAYAYQTLPLYRREVLGAATTPAARESVGLAVALSIARAFRDGMTPWSEEALSEHLDVPLRTVRDVVAQLEKAGIVAPIADPDVHDVWQLARPADRIRVAHVLEALHGPREVPLGPKELAGRIDRVLSELDARHREAGTRTLDELLEER